MAYLYHGTHIKNQESIQKDGIQPRIGEFAAGAYGRTAEGVMPAVFMADDDGLERVVHAIVYSAIDEVTDDDLEEWDVDAMCHLNDALFCKHGVICVIEASESFARTGNPKPGTREPLQAEDGDWYSLDAVRPARYLTGDDLRAFLEDRDVLPSTINDFVDEDRRPLSYSM